MTKEEAKAFVERWCDAGPVPGQVRREEQAEMIDALLEAGLHHDQTKSAVSRTPVAW